MIECGNGGFRVVWVKVGGLGVSELSGGVGIGGCLVALFIWLKRARNRGVRVGVMSVIQGSLLVTREEVLRVG